MFRTFARMLLRGARLPAAAAGNAKASSSQIAVPRAAQPWRSASLQARGLTSLNGQDAMPFAARRQAQAQALQQRRGVAAAAAAADALPAEETFQYQAEVDRLMDMIVNSLYSNRDVFLRELISNASDALDKLRFVGVTDPAALKGREELEILVSADKDAGTVTIEDSGIGMSHEQLLSNLGTIARSGTRKFMEAVKDAKGDASLIGQFGVGFYSAFLVADRVTVLTKSHEDAQAWIWQSAAGSHQYTVKRDDGSAGAPLARGTRVVLHLKEDAAEMADPIRLARLIKQYSQFIQFPIKLYSATKEPKSVVDEEATKRKQDAADAKAKEAGEEPKPVDPVTKTEYEDVWGWRVQNDNKPIWTRSPKDVEAGDYNEFFKATFGEFLDPLAHVHFNVEGTIEFASILYVPGMAPFDQQDWARKSRSIKLYVRRVFISDEFDEDLMPRYLSFIKGVVDSSDLPLNVSREILQESRITRVIRKQLTRRSLEMIDELASKEGGQDYKTFWEAFGRNLKVGVIEDQENRGRLSKLLRFFSSKSGDGMASLEEYKGRMKEGQKAVYYMAADSVEAAAAAPFVEKLAADGYEVLYLTEAIDEAVVTNLGKFDDLELVDVSKEGIELPGGEEDAKKKEALEGQFKDVIAFLKDTLGERVEKVVLSSRLLDSPCALVTSKFGWSANMERIMKAQSMGDARAMEYMRGRRILEVNPEHEVVAGIKTLLDEGDKARAADLSELLYETSLLTSGFSLDAPRDYASKVFTLMKIALGGDVMGGGGSSGSSGGSGSSSGAAAEAEAEAAGKAEAVEAEVMPGDGGNDPWGKK